MYDTILVGTDGSEYANHAVERAIDTAKAHDAALHVMTVVNSKRYGEPALSSKEIILNELEERGNRQLAQVEEMVEGEGIDLTTAVPHGDPTDELLAYAADVGADLIVLGTKGRTHTSSKIGSTANRVVRSTDREVLLV